MLRILTASALTGALMLGLATTAFAAKGEFDDMCAMGLATGKSVKTDCSINGTVDGKTYCFGNEEAKTEFMKDPAANLEKAQSYYSGLEG